MQFRQLLCTLALACEKRRRFLWPCPRAASAAITRTDYRSRCHNTLILINALFHLSSEFIWVLPQLWGYKPLRLASTRDSRIWSICPNINPVSCVRVRERRASTHETGECHSRRARSRLSINPPPPRILYMWERLCIGGGGGREGDHVHRWRRRLCGLGCFLKLASSICFQQTSI